MKPRQRLQQDFSGESRTKQSMAAATDINRMVERYQRSGVIPPVSIETPLYGDFSDVPTYLDALNAVREAEANFMRLPAKIRARVENDPVRFMEFVTDPENADELVELGLATRDEVDSVHGTAVPSPPSGGRTQGAEHPPSPTSPAPAEPASKGENPDA